MSTVTPPDSESIARNVMAALAEDVGSGDLTASLIPATQQSRARIVCRESAILCGRPWVDEVFRQLDTAIRLDWHYGDGDELIPGEPVCSLAGSARTLLTGERSALNFLQLLSGTATETRRYVDTVRDTKAKILDTRKTIPGLRLAQKYAVRCGGGDNHRIGLYDAILIKENHIRAAGGITAAVTAASVYAVPIEVEVENMNELEEAMAAGVERVLLDNFSLADLRAAAAHVNGRMLLEASGGVDIAAVAAIAGTGVDLISIGGLTKHVRAIDYSMLFNSEL